MVNRANGTRENDHRANGNRADVVAPFSSPQDNKNNNNYLLFLSLKQSSDCHLREKSNALI